MLCRYISLYIVCGIELIFRSRVYSYLSSQTLAAFPMPNVMDLPFLFTNFVSSFRLTVRKYHGSLPFSLEELILTAYLHKGWWSQAQCEVRFTSA